MKYKEFKKYLNTICPVDDSTADAWLKWAEELEQYDSSYYELPKGAYTTVEHFLDQFVERIRLIRDMHGDEIAAQIISLAALPACPFPWEMKLAAEHLANGGNIDDIPDMLEKGTLEDFSDILNREQYEEQNLSLGGMS